MTPEEHIIHVMQVLPLLQKAMVTINLKKCRFFINTIEYSERII